MITHAAIDQQVFLQKIKEEVLRVDPEATVILFGSRARGDYREDSDWDILVLTSYPMHWREERQISDRIYDIQLDNDVAVTTLFISKQDWEEKHVITGFYKNVVRDGVEV